MTVVGTAVGSLLKEIRGGETQMQFGFDMGVVRETISKYETGRSRVPADISRNIVDKFDNAKFAITIQHEYTGTGPRWLDGPNVDLHRCSVREKTIEEMKEALFAIESTSMSKPPTALTLQELEDHKNALEEMVELATAVMKYVAVGTDYIGLSYKELWTDHYTQLHKAGFIK